MSPSRTDQVRLLLDYAVLAPSSHNTQPWRFEINDSTISLYADRTRALPANDPEDRELTISCGCALMNLRVAAAHEGFSVACDITPEPDNKDLLAVVSFSGAGAEMTSPSEGELFGSIEARRTYRKRFESREVPSSTLDILSAAATGEGAWFHVIDSQEQRQEIAGLVAEGDSMQWSNPSWRRELAAWMHSRRRGDGLTVPGVVAPIARAVVRTFDMGKGVGAKDRQLADESPVLAVLGTNDDTKRDWLHAGQALEKVLLRAHANGMQASYLNQPIQVASLRTRLQNLLGQTGFAQILLRLGFPTEDPAPTPRRAVYEVIAS